MGIFDKLFKGDEQHAAPAVSTEKNTIYAPVDGMAIALSEINDGVFSSGALGDGCGIYPESETITAPFDGTVSTVADTKHAVGLTSTDGIELLIHVGLDTVSMNGRGFQVYVKEGDTVRCGQKLLSFSKSAIKSAGFLDTTAVLVVNSSDYQSVEVCKKGSIKRLEKLMIAE